MGNLIELIKNQTEMNPDKHDGSYEMVRECLKSLGTLKPEAINTSDLDMLYLMSIITKTIDEKIRSVRKSSLSVSEKDRMANIIEGIKKKAVEGSYQNYNDNKVIGMFGTGFKTFDRGSFDVKDARKLISLCIDISKLSNEETILNNTEKVLNNFSGMVGATGSISQMLHCIHPTIFPVLNNAEYGGRKGFEELGVTFNRVDKTKNYIQNVRVVRDFRNENFTFKNYRVIDYFFWINRNKDLTIPETEKVRLEMPTSANYWWLIANPAEWSFDQIKIGGTETFTSHNDQGTERKIYKNFADAKKGDYVIGYVARPTKAITSICKIYREHNGQDIQIQKVMDIKTPIPYSRLKELEDLSEMEFFKRQIGTLFKLTKDEFDTIMELINEENKPQTEKFEAYTRENFLEEVFFDEEKYDEIASILDYKKNIILQGAPGVGKTFVAKRLAYSIMEKKDDSKVEVVQFHQNYSYEDFIQGYRPNEKGQFELKNGIFYEFCLKAQRDSNNKYYFIIDEINRGNLSKIFGELMMLIECDKRGEDYKISLTYRQEDEKFYIPENLYIIGTMNTADRSLAMVDYALRRRFSFIELEPAFLLESFRIHLINHGIDEEYIDKVIEGMETLNEVIAQDMKNLGKGYCIGHSYFCGELLKNESSEAWYSRIIKFEIKPLLYEYWFEDEETAEKQYQNLL